MGYLRLALSGLEGTPGHRPAMVGLDATAGARGVGPSRAVGCGRCHRLIQGCTEVHQVQKALMHIAHLVHL